MLKAGGQRGWVAGRQHETAKGSYGLTGNDIFESTNKVSQFGETPPALPLDNPFADDNIDVSTS